MQPAEHQMSVVITRLGACLLLHSLYRRSRYFSHLLEKHQLTVGRGRTGWFVRNTEMTVVLAAGHSYGAYLSHDDAGRYFVRVVESVTPLAGESRGSG